MSHPLPHVTINEAEGKADCAECQTGITAPQNFGGIPRADFLASFVIQHAVHTKAGNAKGLTAGGKPTKEAMSVLQAALRGPLAPEQPAPRVTTPETPSERRREPLGWEGDQA